MDGSASVDDDLTVDGKITAGSIETLDGGDITFNDPVRFNDKVYTEDSIVVGSVVADRSATNPATYIDADGKINILTTPNIPRFTYGYYDETGFVEDAEIMEELSSTNYILNSYFSLDSDSDGLGDSWIVSASLSESSTLTTSSINNITGGKTQRSEKTLSSEVVRYNAALATRTENDSIDVSGGNVTVTISFWARGDLSGLTTGTGESSNYWFVAQGETNANAYVQDLSGHRRSISQAVSDGLNASEWRRFEFTATYTNSTVRKIQLAFIKFNATDGDRPTSGESYWFELYGVQIEKQINSTSFVPTTTTAVTRNTETYTGKTIYGDVEFSEKIISPSGDLSISSNTTLTGAQMQNTRVFVYGPTTVGLTATSTFSDPNTIAFSVKAVGDHNIIVQPDITDNFERDGTAMSDGAAITSLTESGDLAVFTYNSNDSSISVSSNDWTAL
jgi:hypothetical protein